jgi:hypothetical protein
MKLALFCKRLKADVVVFFHFFFICPRSCCNGQINGFLFFVHIGLFLFPVSSPTLVGKPEGKRPLGRTRRRWADNIKIHLREIGWDGMDWMDLAQDRDQRKALVNTVMNLRVP